MKGYHDSKTPETIRDLWRTPKFVFDYYDRRFNFSIDMAATKESSLCGMCYISEKMDALLHSTMADAIDELGKVVNAIWCNPPYSKIMPWVAMVTEYAQVYKIPYVMLLPADTSVMWFKLAFDNCTECHFISGRLAFISEDAGKPVSGNNKGSVVFVFDPHSPFKSQVKLIDRDSMK
jgi:phage N-6-adenine-methyltransferase